jgi:hypothetical protein
MPHMAAMTDLVATAVLQNRLAAIAMPSGGRLHMLAGGGGWRAPE